VISEGFSIATFDYQRLFYVGYVGRCLTEGIEKPLPGEASDINTKGQCGHHTTTVRSEKIDE